MAASRHTAAARRSIRARSWCSCGTTSSAPPRRCARIDAASSTMTSTVPDRPRGGSKPSSDLIGRGQSGVVEKPLVNDLDPIAFEHRHVDELPERLAPVLDHQQPRSDDFDDEAVRRQGASRAPHHQFARAAPDAQMNAGPFDGRRQARERRRAQGQRLGKPQRLARIVRRDVGERDLRRHPFFAPQAGPEGAVDHRFDRVRVRLDREGTSPAARADARCRAKCACTRRATARATG